MWPFRKANIPIRGCPVSGLSPQVIWQPTLRHSVNETLEFRKPSPEGHRVSYSNSQNSPLIPPPRAVNTTRVDVAHPLRCVCGEMIKNTVHPFVTLRGISPWKLPALAAIKQIQRLTYLDRLDCLLVGIIWKMERDSNLTLVEGMVCARQVQLVLFRVN